MRKNKKLNKPKKLNKLRKILINKNDLEKHVLQVLQKASFPLAINDIRKDRILPKVLAKDIRLVIQKLIKKNLVFKSQNDYYWLKNNNKIIFAKVLKINKTFGFVKIIDTDEEVFVPGRYMMGALPGDTVIIKINNNFKSRRTAENQSGNLLEGKILVIHQRSKESYFGRVHEIDGNFFFSSDRLNFLLRLNVFGTQDVQSNQLVEVKVVKRGRDNHEHVAEIVSIVGDATDPESCCQLVLAQNNIRSFFGDSVLKEAKKIALQNLDNNQDNINKNIETDEFENRLDLREEVIFTIDGADSKDLDDAVSVKKLNQNFDKDFDDVCWELGVHIADVSHYVKIGSELDKEAFKRGTSVYYADSVVPMLPKELSNGICSLNPGEDRLTFSVIMTLNSSGDIRSYEFKKSVIKSKVKGVYSEINQILNNCETKEVRDKYQEVREKIFLMKELSDLLMEKRFARGSLNLETKECKIKINKINKNNKSKKKIEIVCYERGPSEEIIEEFMLKANEAAAMFAQKQKLPFIYRVHESPPSDKFSVLGNVLVNLGLPRPKNSSQAELSKVIESVKNTKYKYVVNNIILRSLAKAKYSSEYSPHYGLVLANYSHFTSPIRRYPDLVIHRIMSKALKNQDKIKNINKKNASKNMDDKEKKYRYFEDSVAKVALCSSESEKIADTVERQCEDIYKACYMSDFVGQNFQAVVSSVTQHGFYVQLQNTVEGLVHKNTLLDGEYELVSMIELKNLKDAKFSIKIGDLVDVKLTKTDVFSGLIDFELINKLTN